MKQLQKKDYVFLLLISGNERLSIVFCNSVNISKEVARDKIIQVLKTKEVSTYSLNYLGLLDYAEMDKDIINQLHFFEKHGDVWILY